MTTQLVLRLYRLLFGGATVVAMAYQLYHLHDVGRSHPVRFFSFFTIESNILVAFVLLYCAWKGSAHEGGARFDSIRGAATVYISITFVVYGLLLAGYQEELQTTVPWVDSVVHKIVPLAMILDWMIDHPLSRFGFARWRYWLIYPAGYATYSLIRGAIVDWYPYPFLDPRDSGAGSYIAVAGYCLAIAAGALAFSWVVAQVSNRLRVEWLSG